MKTKLPCLDGLRAISILFVLFSHVLFTIDRTVPSWVRLMFARADLGVFIFFILSGFLITRFLLDEYEISGTINLWNFYLGRILRIFPAFYTYLLVLGALTVFGILPIAPSHFMDAAFFLWNYKHIWDPTNGQGNWFFGHFWTLSLEEQFYLLWPLILLLLKARRAAWMALALIIVMPLVRLATYFTFPESRGQLSMMLHTGSDALMFGCLLALLMRHHKMSKVWNWFAAPLWPILAVSFAWIISPLIETQLPGHIEGGYVNTIGRGLTGLSITFIIAWLLKYPECFAGRLLNSRPMLHIGVLSYSLYLWQQLFFTHLNTTWCGKFPFNLGCAYAAALACHKIIERPFLKLKKAICISPAVALPDPQETVGLEKDHASHEPSLQPKTEFVEIAKNKFA